ncbi:MAG: VCBS repeat-containing protein, partial [Cyclobacteriaceae bacterium]|nr:VCBS repeat-containing protein [Cyclobacteriaceae bacterium]
MNIIEYLYFYNGGGVAIGDVNNDGLPDLYFSANQLENRLYLNKGDFQFEDITAKAGVAGEGNWKTGVTMADVNGDGFLDIFICGVGGYKSFTGRNQLFINNQDLTFSDQTEKYGLSFQGFSTQASFFDYDKDGDLDMYLVN